MTLYNKAIPVGLCIILALLAGTSPYLFNSLEAAVHRDPDVERPRLIAFSPVKTPLLIARSSDSQGNNLIPSYSRQPVTLNEHEIYYTNKAILLMYHHIDEQPGPSRLTRDNFASHLEMLDRNRYQVISIEEYVLFLDGQLELPPNAVVITFDDGYDSFYYHALPELLRYGYPAVNFIVVGSTDYFDPRAIPHLSWDQMRRMKVHGMSFYSHTYDLHYQTTIHPRGIQGPALAHPIMDSNTGRLETEMEYRTRIRQDLLRAEARLKLELGNLLSMLCFPYGAYSQTVLEVAGEIGIRHFFTVREGINTADSTLAYRINAGEHYVSAERLEQLMEQYHD